MDKLLELFGPLIAEHFQSAIVLYSMGATVLIWILRERIKLLKAENSFSKKRRTAAQDDLRDATKRSTSAVEHAPVNSPPISLTDFDILLIDDEEAVLSYKESIEEHFPGSRVRTARNAAEAWKQIEQLTPSLVITDMIMPIMDGYSLLRKLAVQFPNVPALTISAYVNSREEIINKLGPIRLQIAFLPKPFTFRKLIGAINKLRPKENRFRKWIRRNLFRGRMLKAQRTFR